MQPTSETFHGEHISPVKQKSAKQQGPRGCKAGRDWTNVQKLLDLHNITNRDIQGACGVPLPTVNRILQRSVFGSVRHEFVVLTRAAAENLLIAHGEHQAQKEGFWGEYDNTII